MQEIHEYQIEVQGKIDESTFNATSPLQVQVKKTDEMSTLMTIQSDQSGLVGLIRHFHHQGFSLLSFRASKILTIKRKIMRIDERKITFDDQNATRIIATTIGVFFGLFSGVNHGFFELLQGNIPTNGLLIHAIGEDQRFWLLGTEDAFTLIPNFMFTGIVSMIVGLAIVVWSLWFLPTKQGRTIFLGLFILSFLVGGGIGQVAFFLPAWAFATRMGKPLTWWRKVLPRSSWAFLSKLWVPLLILATLVMMIGLEMAIFGYFPGLAEPTSIQDAAMFFVLTAAILYILSFLAGFGHELGRMERNHQNVI